MNLTNLKKIDVVALIEYGKRCGIKNAQNLQKYELICTILKIFYNNGKSIFCTGVLEILVDGFGFLRFLTNSYNATEEDVYVSPSFIKKFFLKTGDKIDCSICPPKNCDEKYFSLHEIKKINDIKIEDVVRNVSFENLTPLHVNERFIFEIKNSDTVNNITARIIDIITPIGKGQRALLVSPPKAGKTVVLQNIAKSLSINHPDIFLMVLLIDERPEEVTEMKRLVIGDVISSTFDESPKHHVQIAEIVIERAKRLVELKKDVVILLDSITRLARAYNAVITSSGRVLTGGIDINALQKPKFFFGSARNIEEGGSLTIIATALVETGSRMDSVIFEEFKGTGNSEIHLDCKISERRIYPALNIAKSSTRREELIIDSRNLKRIWILRKLLHSMDDCAAIEFLIKQIKESKNNNVFFDNMHCL